MIGRALVIAALSGAAILAASAFAQTTPPRVAEVRVLSSNGVRAVMEDLQGEIEQAIGYPLSIEFSTALSLKSRIDAGEHFDVAILTPPLIDELARAGKISGSRMDFARAGVGVGAPASAPKMDVGTAEALERTLRDAESLAYTADGQSRVVVDKAFERLGIADEMRAKTLLKGPGEAPAAVAAGEAALVLTLISEIVPVEGLQLLGPLPPELQGYVSFAAGASSAARDGIAAAALVQYLTRPSVASALASHGMEPAAGAAP